MSNENQQNSHLAALLHDVKRSILLNEQFIYRMRKALESGEIKTVAGILDRMEAAYAGMLVFVNAVMLADKDASGTLKVHPLEIDINEIVRESIRLLDPRCKLIDTSILSELQKNLPPVSVDPTVFSSVTNNLIDNALKYSNPGEAVKVRTYKNSSGDVVLEVSNRGLQIEESDRDKVFEKHSRGSNVNMIPGTGLGLYLAKRVVEAHGANLELLNQDPDTVFRVTLKSTGAK